MHEVYAIVGQTSFMIIIRHTQHMILCWRQVGIWSSDTHVGWIDRSKALSLNDFILVKCVEGGLKYGVNMGKSVEWKLDTATHTPVLLENTTPTRGKLNNHSNV